MTLTLFGKIKWLSSMSFGFTGYHQHSIIWFHSFVYVVMQFCVIFDRTLLENKLTIAIWSGSYKTVSFTSDGSSLCIISFIVLNIITTIIKCGMKLLIHPQTVEVWEWISNFIPNYTLGVWFHTTLSLACEYLSMLGLKLTHVSKGVLGHTGTWYIDINLISNNLHCTW